MTSSIVSGSSLLRQFRFLPSSSLARRSIVAIGSGRGIASTSASASTSSDHVHAHHISAENAVVPPPSVVHLPLTEWPSPAASTASIPSPADPQTVEPPATTSPAYVTLPAHVFASPSRPDILHRCVVTHLSNLRQGTARTKNRAETKGSNRKIMRQKGTGKARVGDIRSPIRRGGGRAFPKRERDWTLGLNRKVWELGVRTALSERWRRGELAVIPTSPILAEISTRALSQSLRFSPFSIRESSHKTLFLVSDLNAEFVLSAQNLPNVDVAHISEIEVYPLLQGQRVVLDVDAVQYLEDWLGEDAQRVSGKSYLQDADLDSTADPDFAVTTLAEAHESAGVLEGEAATIMAEFESGSDRAGGLGEDGQTSPDSLGGGYKDQDVVVEGEEAGVQEQRHPEDPLKRKNGPSSSADKGEAIREEMEKVGEEQKKKGTEDEDRPNLKDVL